MAAIVTLGELLAEFMAEELGQSFLAPGRYLGPYPGGAPAIFADQAAKLGASVAMIGCVGADAFGDLLVDRLRADGVDMRAIRRSADRPTATAFVTYGRDGSREFIFNITHSAAGLIDADSVDAALLADCRYFHVMGSTLESPGCYAAVLRVVKQVKQQGGKVSFDPNVRPEMLGSSTLREALLWMLGQCDVLLPSDAELAHFFVDRSEDEAVAALFDRNPLSMVVVKRAARGCALYERERLIEMPSFRVAEVDPTGAGDCFGATLVACLERGMDRERALLLANAAGALAVTKRGAMEGTSTLEALERFIANAERRT